MMSTYKTQVSIRALLPMRCALSWQFSRGKKSKAKLSYGKHKTDPTEMALKNFDQNYRPLFGDRWPTIRMALLSLQSYGALLNNYSDSHTTVDKLHGLGLRDFIQPGAKRLVKINARKQFERDRDRHAGEEEALQAGLQSDTPSHFPRETEVDSLALSQELQKREMMKVARDEELELVDEEFLENDPDERMGQSSKEREIKPWWEGKYIVAAGFEHRMDQIQQMELEARGEGEMSVGYSDVDVNVVDADIEISRNLRCFVRKNDPKRIPQAKMGSELPNLQYYIMDAASTLPVVALDISEDDVVLDLCAGPGGKSVAILQTMLVASLTANEKVSSRKRRLQEVFELCLPRRVRSSGAVRVSNLDGCEWGRIEPASYDKVLVDVPCSTDRVSVTEGDNNIFKVNRSRERWNLPQLQADLLCAGLQAVKPGGTVVYSTCTMSPLQNDGVVQTAIARCQEEFDISANVVDLSPLAGAFRNTFTFFPNCRYGQLIVPTIFKNYGPMYFARLVRTV